MKPSSHQANKKQEKENPIRSNTFIKNLQRDFNHDTLTKEKEDENLRKERLTKKLSRGVGLK